MIFCNTVLRECCKLIAGNLEPSFVVHCNPVSSFGGMPYCVLNQIHVKNKEELYKLMITLIELSSQK